MPDTFYQDVTTIEEAKFENNRYAIKANKLTFSFFKTKQDGNETKAYLSYQTMKPQIGDTIGIVFTEKDAPQGGKYRNIIEFKEADKIEKNAPVSVPYISLPVLD